MDYSDSYKWIYAHYAPCGDETQQDAAITTALDALKKQISKKPIYDPLRNGLITTAYKCPLCGCRRLGHGFDLDKCFCPECGQKLDWRLQGDE